MLTALQAKKNTEYFIKNALSKNLPKELKEAVALVEEKAEQGVFSAVYNPLFPDLIAHLAEALRGLGFKLPTHPLRIMGAR